MKQIVTNSGYLTFEIERNPEEEENPIGTGCAYRVWEHVSEDPDGDEIVETFPTYAEAEAWIEKQHENPQPYLERRGLA